ncbi:unknown [Tannerella sp. CAG:118]|nr:unknown [Tannerella sp. CAG:118]
MSDDFGYLRTGDAVLLGRLQMEYQRMVRNTLADERSNRYQAAVAQAELVGAAPYLSEKNIVVKFRKFGGEFTQLVAPCRLYYLFLCHNIER